MAAFVPGFSDATLLVGLPVDGSSNTRPVRTHRGPSLGGGTLHAVDLFYDNLGPQPARFFTKSATVELVNARGESFGLVGGMVVGDGCGPGLSLGEGAKPGARLRGWPFAGLPAGTEPPTQVRMVLEEPTASPFPP